MNQKAQSLRIYLEKLISDPAYHDVLVILKTIRNGAIYGTKVRFFHALVLISVFQSASIQHKAFSIFKVTKQHALNLAKFAGFYKLTLLALRNNALVKRKEGSYDFFIAGVLSGYLVFGGRSKSTGKIPPVNEQIFIYVFARVALGLAQLAIMPKTGFPVIREQPLRSNIQYWAWPAFSSLMWGTAMHLFQFYPEVLPGSMLSSMKFIYKDCEE